MFSLLFFFLSWYLAENQWQYFREEVLGENIEIIDYA